MNPEVHGVPGEENAYLGLFGRWVSFVWLPLPKIGNRPSEFPERVVEGAIQTWRGVHTDCFRNAHLLL